LERINSSPPQPPPVIAFYIYQRNRNQTRKNKSAEQTCDDSPSAPDPVAH
jgi:hypothetical protein